MTQLTILTAQIDQLSKKEIIQAFSSLTPSKIVKAGYPSVSVLSRQYGPAKIERSLSVLFSDFGNSFDKPLKPVQVEELTAELTSDYMMRSLSLEDVYYALRELKINNQYGAISINKVLKSLRDHNAVRMETVQRLNESKHASGKYLHAERSSEQSNAPTNEQLKGFKEIYYGTNNKTTNKGS